MNVWEVRYSLGGRCTEELDYLTRNLSPKNTNLFLKMRDMGGDVVLNQTDIFLLE